MGHCQIPTQYPRLQPLFDSGYDIRDFLRILKRYFIFCGFSLSLSPSIKYRRPRGAPPARLASAAPVSFSKLFKIFSLTSSQKGRAIDCNPPPPPGAMIVCHSPAADLPSHLIGNRIFFFNVRSQRTHCDKFACILLALAGLGRLGCRIAARTSETPAVSSPSLK